MLHLTLETSREGRSCGQVHSSSFETGELDVDYDEEAEVLYISFGLPVAASDGRVLDNDVVVLYKGEPITGITVPRLKKRLEHA